MEVFSNKNNGIELGLYTLGESFIPTDKENPMIEHQRIHLAALYGASSVFEKRVSSYRNAAEESDHDIEKLPIGFGTMMYLEHDSQSHSKIIPIFELYI